MKIDFSKDPELVAMNKKQEEEGMKELNGILDELIGSGKMGKGAMPPEKDLNKLEKGTYKTNFEVPGYQILAKSPTVIFYKRITDNTVVIAVRGSSDKRDWLQTNTMLPFGRLTTTSRYKEDKKFVADNLAKFSQGNDVYIVGHSLGGAIANQLQIDFPIIQGGITFNPAFQPMDFLNKSKIQRKYTSGDPLGKLGRYLPGSMVEDDSSLLDRFLPSVGLMGKSHQLSSFQSGQEGGAKVVMDKKAYVKEHKKLIKLLEKAGKEGKKQKKELEKELKIGGIKIVGFENFKQQYQYQKGLKRMNKVWVDAINHYIDTELPRRLPVDTDRYPKLVIPEPKHKPYPKKPKDTTTRTVSTEPFEEEEEIKLPPPTKAEIVEKLKSMKERYPEVAPDADVYERFLVKNTLPGVPIVWLNTDVERIEPKPNKSGEGRHHRHRQLAKKLKKGGNLTDEQINKYKFDAKKELDEWIHDKQQKMKKQGVPTIDILKQYNSSDLEEVDELIHKIENKLELAFKKGYDIKVKDLVLKQDRNEDEKVKLIIRLLLKNNNKKLNSDLTNKVRDLGDELGVNLNASSSGIMANLIKIPEYNVEVADFESFTPSEHKKPIVIALGKSNDGDLHAIIIKKKGYNKNDAVVEAAKFKTSKGLFMRETKLSYRFRNIPKTKFEPKSFRTKKINKNISLVYGKLK